MNLLLLIMVMVMMSRIVQLVLTLSLFETSYLHYHISDK